MKGKIQENHGRDTVPGVVVFSSNPRHDGVGYNRAYVGS